MPRPRVLTELDEWPRHQTIDTFNSVQTASPEWSDGYWHCFGDPAGEVNLITAIRLYPNTDVMDAYAIVSLDDGKQYNLRASRRLRPRIDELRVGPFWQEIIRGMRTLRIGCDDNAHGIEFDILWESKAPAYDEAPGVQYRLDGRLVAERSNYIQAADIAGWIRINGREWKFDFGDGWGGTRDHSWGIGAGTGTGAKPNPDVAPPLTPPEQGSFRSDGMRHWAVVNMPDRCLYYAFRLGEDGIYRASGTGRQSDVGVHSWVEYAYDSDKESFAYTDVSISDHEWEDGFPRFKRGKIHLTRPDGVVENYQLEVVSEPVYMLAGGYAHGWNDRLGRGVFRGELLVEGEVWDVSHPTKVFDDDGNEIPQMSGGGSYAELSTVYTNMDDPSDTGVGILECAIMTEFEGVKGP